ncbi:MAG: 4-oxalocrotonate decarboxylase [Acidimicrobiia bacterium]|nr:MAG: 4-oxalocrotonate decarboxylase [Acidimicrobiia bacterium]
MNVDDLARRLFEAIQNRRATTPDPDLDDPETAYRVQERLVELLGGTPKALKLGLTSRAKQTQMNVSEPLYGWLVDWMQLDIGQPLTCSELIQPRAEPEIGFLLGKKLAGPNLTATHVMAATDAVFCAFDILDSRYAGYRFTLPHVIADDASAGRFLLGDPVDPTGIDLRTVGCVFTKNGETIATAAGAAVLGHPAAAVAWAANRLTQRGHHLEPGTIVLAGALTEAVPIQPGDTVTVELDRIGTLTLPCR